MPDLHLRLIIDVDYETNGEDPLRLRSQLYRLAQHAVDEGLLTGSLDSVVDEWTSAVITR